jgi:hypothetical protein
MSNMTVGIVLVLAVLVAEVILSMTWNRVYFTFGIPIFIRRIDRPRGLDDVSLDELPRSAATVAGAPFVFRRLPSGAIAFREKLFGGMLHYAPLMRGVIRHNAGEASVVVTGLINWTAVALVAFFVVLLGRGAIDVAPYFLVAFGILYLIQSLRYSRIAKALRSDR